MTPDDHRQIVTLLKRIPDYEDQDRRRNLKSGLPLEIRDQIEDDGSPATHLNNILRVTDLELDTPPAGVSWPIMILIDNAMSWASYYIATPGVQEIVIDLKALRGTLETRAIERIAGIGARIADALASAFLTRRKLDLFVRFYLNENLFVNISGPGPVRKVAVQLVDWYAKNGNLALLIDSALLANPGDPYLRAVAVETARAEPTQPYSPEERLSNIHIQQLSLCLSRLFVYQELEAFVLAHLCVKLEAVSLRPDLLDIAVDLVLWCEARGWTSKLVESALAERPGDPALLLIVGSPRPERPVSSNVDGATIKVGPVMAALAYGLARAFSYGELHRLVMRTFGRDLESVAGRGSLKEVAYELLEWANNNGLVDTLVGAVRRVKPDEVLFQLYPDISPNSYSPYAFANSLQGDTPPVQSSELWQCSEAIVECFSYSELKQVVLSTFSISLEIITLADNLESVVGDLLGWVHQRGQVRRLLEAMLSAKPNNLSFCACAERLGIGRDREAAGEGDSPPFSFQAATQSST
jgi:hypothetical protein